MMLRVVVSDTPESGNFRVLKWDLVANNYVANPINNEYTFPVADLPEDFPLNYHTYVVTPEVALIRLAETLDRKVINPLDWDDTYEPMLTRVHDTFI